MWKQTSEKKNITCAKNIYIWNLVLWRMVNIQEVLLVIQWWNEIIKAKKNVSTKKMEIKMFFILHTVLIITIIFTVVSVFWCFKRHQSRQEQVKRNWFQSNNFKMSIRFKEI